VSIVTPVFNGAAYLDELINSVLRQDYPHIEHIIIDDGSTDDGATVSILQRYPHLRWWSSNHKGQYATLNEGLAAARGSVVSIISADDKYVAPSTFSAVVRYWQLHPECGCIYGQALFIDDRGDPLPFLPPLGAGPFSLLVLRYQCKIAHCSLFVAKVLLLEGNIWFDPSYQYHGDWDWIIRLSMAVRFGYVNQCLSHYRVHASQTTQRMNRETHNREVRKIVQQYKTNRASYFLLVWLLRISTGLHVLRRRGPQGLRMAVKEWLNRRSGWG